MAVWQKENKTDKALKITLFLVSPFIAFLYSLRSIKTKSSYIVFFLFCLFFGMAFTVESGKTDDNSIDGTSYREKFESYRTVGEQEYYDRFKEYLTFEEGARDYYFDTVAFYVSRVTGNYHVMFLVFAFVFAYFGLKSLKFLTAEDKFNASLSCLILVYLFMINQIFNINGVRFWTAAWVGVYCIFQIFRNDNKRYFLLALLTPFFHGSFWIFLLVIVGAYFSRKNYKIWIPLFFISFLVSNVSIYLIQGIIDSLPPFLARMAQSYTNPEYIEERSAKGTGFYWVADVFDFLVRFYMNYLVFLFIKNAKTISTNPKTQTLFSFILIWMTFVNFTMAIPSLGGRYMLLAYPIIAYIWLVNFKGVKYRNVLYAMPFVFLFSFFGQLKLYNLVIDPFFYFSSPLYLIYKYLI